MSTQYAKSEAGLLVVTEPVVREFDKKSLEAYREQCLKMIENDQSHIAKLQVEVAKANELLAKCVELQVVDAVAPKEEVKEPVVEAPVEEVA